MAVILTFFFLHWYLSLFTQTFFHHRYSAHKMFSMTPFMEKIFFVISWIFQGSSYVSPYAYGLMHRLHHAYADTEKDPHSPKFAKNLLDMMAKTRNIYSAIVHDRYEVEEKYKKDLPRWASFDTFADGWAGRIIWIVIYVAVYIMFAPSLIWFLLLPIHFLMGPFHGAIINWFAHRIGYTNYTVSNTSKNLMPVDIFMLGEGFHNNHHKHGSRPNFGSRWFEFDPVYPVILLFDKLRIIRLPRASSLIPVPVIEGKGTE